MRALMSFMNRRNGWTFHILADDAGTVLMTYRRVHDQETLLRIIAKLHGDSAAAAEDMRRWGRGSVWIDPSPEQCKALGIFHP